MTGPSHRAAVSAQRAADVLNVSPLFVIQLLESGKLRYLMVGGERWVDLGSVLEYKRIDDARTLRSANELTALGEELEMI